MTPDESNKAKNILHLLQCPHCGNNSNLKMEGELVKCTCGCIMMVKETPGGVPWVYPIGEKKA